MILFIGMLLCAIGLWSIGHVGLKNYQYDHDDDMTTSKILNFCLLSVLVILLILKQFVFV